MEEKGWYKRKMIFSLAGITLISFLRSDRNLKAPTLY